MNIISRFFGGKFKEVKDYLASYEGIHHDISKTISTYRKSIVNGENKPFYSIDKLVGEAAKTACLELSSTTAMIDEVIHQYENETKDDFLSKYAMRIPKGSKIDFSGRKVESDPTFELAVFPVSETGDSSTYCQVMIDSLSAYLGFSQNVEKIKAVIKGFEDNGQNPIKFKNLLKLNEQEMSKQKLLFMSEVANTKVLVDETMNFIPFPTSLEPKTIAIHAYYRKMVDEKFLSNEIVFKRFVKSGSYPSFVKYDELGLVVL